MLYALAVIALILALKERVSANWLVRLGLDSYGVYYVHMLWIWIVGAALMRVPILPDVLPAFQIVQVASVIVLSLATMHVARRVVGRERAARYLGF